MKLLTRQCAGGGCRSTAAVRLVLLAGEGRQRERNPRSLPLPAFPQRLFHSSESKPTQTALGSFCKRGGGAGPGSLSTSSSPPFGDLPPLADLLLLPLPSRAATLRAAGKAQRCSRGKTAALGRTGSGAHAVCSLGARVGGAVPPLCRGWSGLEPARGVASPLRPGALRRRRRRRGVSRASFPAPRADPTRAGRRRCGGGDVPGGMRV